MHSRPQRAGLAFAAATLAAILSANAARAADFYAGKTIDFVIGSDVGGGYDIYARTIARHLARFIPGNPTIVPKNQPGAGSARAGVLPLFGRRRRTARSSARSFPACSSRPLLDEKSQGQFDPTKFQLSRQRRQRHARVHHVGKVQGQELRRRPEAEDHHGRERGGRLDPRLRQHAPQERGRACSRWSPATKAPPTFSSPWSAAKSTACAARLVEPQVAAAGLDSRQDREHPRAGRTWSRSRSSPGSAFRKSGNSSRAPTTAKRSSSSSASRCSDGPISRRRACRPTGSRSCAQPSPRPFKDKDFLADAEKARIDIAPSSGEKVQELVEKIYAMPKPIVERARELVKP